MVNPSGGVIRNVSPSMPRSIGPPEFTVNVDASQAIRPGTRWGHPAATAARNSLTTGSASTSAITPS